jgi:hypothetical protein
VFAKSSFAGLASDTSVAGPASGSIADEHTQVWDPDMILQVPDILVDAWMCHLAVRQMNSGGSSFELASNLVESGREDCISEVGALTSFGEIAVSAAPAVHISRAKTQEEGFEVANYETSGVSRGYDTSQCCILIE